MAKLTDKQAAFVAAYLGPARFNAFKAALMAGYSAKTAKSQGHELSHRPSVRAEIRRRMRDEGITPERIKIAFAQEAFDSDMADFQAFFTADAKGKFKSLDDLRRAGVPTHLIKSVRISKTDSGTTRSIELYSSHDALKELARILAIAGDRLDVDVTSKGERIGGLDLLALSPALKQQVCEELGGPAE